MKNEKRQFIFFIVVLVLLFIYGQFRGDSGRYLTMSPDEDGIVFTCGDTFEEDILYEEVRSIELVDDLDLGESIESTKKGKLISGSYENEAYGSYRLAVYSNVDRWIVMNVNDHIFVVNYTTETETEQLYDTLLEQIEAS